MTISSLFITSSASLCQQELFNAGTYVAEGPTVICLYMRRSWGLTIPLHGNGLAVNSQTVNPHELAASKTITVGQRMDWKVIALDDECKCLTRNVTMDKTVNNVTCLKVLHSIIRLSTFHVHSCERSVIWSGLLFGLHMIIRTKRESPKERHAS